MTSLVNRLDRAGVRMSAQRRIIAECLDGEDRHATAAGLLEQAQEVLPEIGRATVYKALASFVESGQVAEVDVGDGPTCFDPNANVA
ncbi:MAG: transcriptional repressor, partial [Acidimicrobiales bacterium]